jgi:demethoxyubiquinone hydroxylase (CLK1/Coq7/Cat5 family)
MIQGEHHMVRRSREEAQRMLRALAVLMRNTTWKCGRVERLVVNHLREQLRKFGKAQSPIREMLQKFKLKGKQKSEFFDAIKRLEKRRIIKIVKIESF